MSQKSIKRLRLKLGKESVIVGYIIHAHGEMFISRELQPFSTLGHLKHEWAYYGIDSKYCMEIKHDSWDEGKFLSNGEVLFSGDRVTRQFRGVVNEWQPDIQGWKPIVKTHTAAGTLLYGDYEWEIKPDVREIMDAINGDFYGKSGERAWKWDELTKLEE